MVGHGMEPVNLGALGLRIQHMWTAATPSSLSQADMSQPYTPTGVWGGWSSPEAIVKGM